MGTAIRIYKGEAPPSDEQSEERRWGHKPTLLALLVAWLITKIVNKARLYRSRLISMASLVNITSLVNLALYDQTG